MPDNDGLPFSKRCNERDHVADMIEDAVRMDIGGRAASSKTPHIRCCDMETRGCKRWHLMPPGIG
jgi:hypothetical protein